MAPDEGFDVLRTALDQLTGLLDGVNGEVLGDRTPCEQWTVRDLVDHIVAAPARFARMVRGEPIDGSARTAASAEDPAVDFRSNAADLLSAWQERGDQVPPARLDWQCAELAVHTWDLATATGRSTSDLDPEVAERGLAFMQVSLTEDNRPPAFGPGQPVPSGADAYQRIAAFAGRSV